MRRLVFLISVAGALSCVVAAARAQSEPEPPAAYRDLIERAFAESSAARWLEARALFVQAHAVYPNARTLRGIGMVAYEIRDYEDSVRHLRLALLEPRRALDPAQRADTEKLLDRALSFVARFQLTDLPAGSQLVVDGRPAQPEPDGELLVPLGEHHVEVRAGERVANATITVRGGERQPLPVVFEEAHANAPPALAPSAPAVESPAAPIPEYVATEEHAGDRPFPTLPVVAVVTGAVFLLAGTITLVSGLSDARAVENAPLGTAWSKVSAQNDRAPVLTGLGIGLISAGTLLGAAGTIGIVLHHRGEASQDDVDGASIEVRSWF